MFFISDYDWSVMERFEYETYDTMDPDPDPNHESQVISVDCGDTTMWCHVPKFSVISF